MRDIVPARAAEVVSSNVVGYNKITLTPGYNMLSPMFSYIGGEVKDIVDIFEEKDVFTASDTTSDADYILLWYAGKYQETYFYSSDAGNKWSSDQDGFDETTDPLPENLGFWLYNRGQQMTVTLAGEVPTNGVEVAITPGYNMIANPFAGKLPIKSIVPKTGEFVASDTTSDADYILIWRNGGYDTTYFFSSDANNKWSSDQDGFDETEDTLAPGEAFWFYRRGEAMTISIPAPYTL